MTLEENSLGDERARQLDAIVAAYYRAIEAGECIDQKDFVQKHPRLQHIGLPLTFWLNAVTTLSRSIYCVMRDSLWELNARKKNETFCATVASRKFA